MRTKCGRSHERSALEGDGFVLDRIFVQISSYRDTACQSTINDLFAKASYPQRIALGVCVEDVPNDVALIAPSNIDRQQLRITRHRWETMHGVCAARRAAQLLWNGEDFVLSIESRMRFVTGWDVKLIAQLAECRSSKPVLSHRPAFYAPPNVLEEAVFPTVIKAIPNDGFGEVQFIAVELRSNAIAPLRGAFISAHFIFSRSNIIDEVPYDPLLDTDQEEPSLSARFFTHGFDVFSPSSVVAFQLCYEDLEPPKDPDNSALRFAFLRNAVATAPHAVLQDIDRYDFGTTRSLEEYRDFCGLDMRNNSTSPLAISGSFIEHLAEYSDERSTTHDAILDTLKSPTFPQAALHKNRATFDLSRETFDPSSVALNAPTGILVMRNYLDTTACAQITAYVESQQRATIGVHVAPTQGGTNFGPRTGGTRKTDHVDIDGMVFATINLFNDVFCNRVAPYFDTAFEYYERPQLLRYDVGGHYNRHADSECWNADTHEWKRTNARDYSVILYLNDDYEGGMLSFTDHKYDLKPERGMLVAFPSDHRYAHAVYPTTRGIRYAFVSWAKTRGSKAMPNGPNIARIDLFERG